MNQKQISCFRCNDTGVNDLYPMKFCICEHGRQLEKDVNDGKKCPICENHGYNRRANWPYFCKCVHGKRLKRQIADNKATCPICYNRGVKDKNSFCTCKHGEDYLRQIEEGSKVCELCKNKGVIIPTHFLCDPHDHMIYGDFCQCKHGKDAILLAKEDPENCPICYGRTTGSYVDGLGFVVSWNTCPHVNARV